MSETENGDTVPVTNGFIIKNPKINDSAVFSTGLNFSFVGFSSALTVMKFFTLVLIMAFSPDIFYHFRFFIYTYYIL